MNERVGAFNGWAIDRDYLFESVTGEPADQFDTPSRVGYGMDTADVASTRAKFFNQIDITTGLRAADVRDPVRFRALDDDGEVYYGGAVTQDWVLDPESPAYEIVKYVEADAGATEVQFRGRDLPEYFVEHHRSIGAIVQSGDTEWVQVYG
jgi:hypothetical protein